MTPTGGTATGLARGLGDIPTAARRAIIALAGVTAVGCLLVPAALGGRPEIFGVIFLSWSAAYVLAGALGWSMRPRNATGPLLLGIGVAGGLILLGRLPIPWIGLVTQLGATAATVLLFVALAVSPGGRFSSRLDLFAVVLISVIYVMTTVVRLPSLAGAAGPVLSALSAALLLLVINRWRRASHIERRALGPAALAGATAAAIFLMNGAAIILQIPNEPGSAVFLVDAVGRALVPFGFLAGMLRLRLARLAIADLVTDLGELPARGSVQAALAGALRDPTLQVGYWSSAADAYLDGEGGLVRVPGTGEARGVLELGDGPTPVAVIVHDPALGDDPGLVAAVAAAVRLTVDNARLRAEVEEQLAEARASRARIVDAGDAERKRLERDLHDGAQQRLVGLALALRLMKVRLADDADESLRASLDAASAEARSALAELRELARGLHPAILTEAGLGPAVQSLADRSRVPTTVDGAIEERLSQAIESTAYFVVSEALANVNKYADATQAAVRIDREADTLFVQISDDGVGNADPSRGTGLSGLIDRLAAVDGTLEIKSPPNAGTILTARIPLRPVDAGVSGLTPAQ